MGSEIANGPLVSLTATETNVFWVAVSFTP